MHSFRRFQGSPEAIDPPPLDHPSSFLMSPSEALAFKEQGNVLFKSSRFQL